MYMSQLQPVKRFRWFAILTQVLFWQSVTFGQELPVTLDTEAAVSQPGQVSVDAITSADWPRWRGPSDSGSVAGKNFPATLDPGKLAWKVELSGKGCSTPIVLDRKIYLSVPDGDKDSLVCFDSTGKKIWQTRFGQQDAGKHRNGSGSNASPTTDGDAVFVYFKSGTFAAVELDGTVRWKKNLNELYGKTELYWSHGTSPVLTNNHVVMARMHSGDSWVAAFDKTDGQEVWKVARDFETPREGDHGYATPVVLQHAQKEALLVYGAEQLTLHDARDGQAYWSCGGFNPDKIELWPTIATPVVLGDIAVVAAGRNDRRLPLLYGVELKGSGDVGADRHLWKRTDTGTFVPSPATWNGSVYLLRDRGQFECLDPATGQTIWEGHFPKHRTRFYSSPLIAGGKLYAIREDGMMFVADISGGSLNVLSEHKLKESVIGSPIPLGNKILVRGEKHLFCFGE